MKRLTGEELAELERDAAERAKCLAVDDVFHSGRAVIALIEELRELRKLVPTEEEEREWRAFHEDMFPGGCGFERQMRGEDLRGKVVKQMYDVAEVEELRAFKGRVEGYRDRLAAEMRASARRLAFFRYDTHARVIAELAAYAALGEYDAAVFGEPAEGGAR